MLRARSGFTIVELLIVIVVIGILAAITIVAYNGVRQKAQIASVSDGLEKVGKAFTLWSIDEGLSTWPTEPTSGGGTSLADFIQQNSSFGQYLQTPPSVVGVQTEDWFYDSEGDHRKTTCDGTNGDTYDGVNIVLRYVKDQAIAQGVDDQLDDGNLACGKVRYVNDRIFYNISYDYLYVGN